MCSSLSRVCDPPLSEAMFCDICCSEPDFCRTCCCILCSKAVCSAFGGYSYIRCKAMFDGYICGHVAHMACAHQARMAGTVGGKYSLDAEYFCRRCDSRTDLVSHILEVLQICESINSRDEIEKTLNLAINLLRGSKKMNARWLLHHIESIVAKLKNGANFGDVRKNEDAVKVIPEMAAAQAVYPENKWLPIKDNNYRMDWSNFTTPDAVIVAILKGHPLVRMFTAEAANILKVYLQQFWGTLNPTPEEGTYTAMINTTQVTFTKAIFKELLQIPDTEHALLFEPGLLADYIGMGCREPLTKISQFVVLKIPHPWRSLFGIVNKCLSAKHTGYDKCNLVLMQILHDICFSQNYDVARLLCRDLDEQITQRRKNAKHHCIPFTRFFSLVIERFMQQHPEIPTAADLECLPSDIFTSPTLKYVHKAKDAAGQWMPMIIPMSLLNLADPADPAVIAYCQANEF